MESAAEEDLALPPEVWHRIMRFLAPADLYHIKCVCSDWAKYIQSDGPWNTYLERYFGKRYAKARFVSDPTFSAMERFWRTTRLHDNWVKGVQQQSVLGGSFGSVRQLKLDGETLAINTGTQLQVYDFEKQQTVWHLPDDMPAHYHIPTFDIKNKVIVMPGTRGTSLQAGKVRGKPICLVLGRCACFMHAFPLPFLLFGACTSAVSDLCAVSGSPNTPDQAHLIFIDTLTGKRKQCISTGQHIYVARLAPGTSTLCATGGRKIQVWDTLHSSNAILTLGEQHRGVVNCLELDVNTVTACHKGKKIRMWDVRSKERILTLSGHNHLIHCIAINGHNIASGSKDHTLRLWVRFLFCHSRPFALFCLVSATLT